MGGNVLNIAACLIRPGIVCALILAPLAGAGHAYAQIAPSYRLVELGTLGQRNYAFRVNAQGEAVGAYYNGSSPQDYHTFVYRNGRMTSPFPGEVTRPTGINESGAVSGWGFRGRALQGWVYADGARTAIPAFREDISYAHGINDAGDAVGWGPGLTVDWHPLLFSGGQTSDLGLPRGASSGLATDINNSGDVVAVVQAGGGNQPALYRDGGWSYLAPDYPTGGWVSGVNNSGEAAGWVYVLGAFDYRAFRHRDGLLTLIGGPNSNTSTGDINDAGLVVGSFGPENARRAFVDDGTRFVDLNSLLEPGTGWVLYHAEGISNAGHIVGYGRERGGAERAFMLVPVPEPGSAALGASAVAWLILRRRRSGVHSARSLRLRRVRKACNVPSTANVPIADHAPGGRGTGLGVGPGSPLAVAAGKLPRISPVRNACVRRLMYAWPSSSAAMIFFAASSGWNSSHPQLTSGGFWRSRVPE